MVNSQSGMTILHHAARLGRPGHAQLLLNYGAEHEVRDDMERTVLHVAVRDRQYDIIKLLLEVGADLEAKDMSGHTPAEYLDPDNETDKSIVNLLNDAILRELNESKRRNSIHRRDTITKSSNNPLSAVMEEKDIKRNESFVSELSSALSFESANELTNKSMLQLLPVPQSPPKEQQDLPNLTIGQVIAQSEKYKETIEKYEAQITKLVQKLEKERNVRQSQTDEYLRALGQLTTLEKNLSEIKDLYQKSKTRLEELDTQKARMDGEVDALNQRLQDAQSQLSQTGNERNEELNVLKLQIKMKEKHIQDLEAEVRHAQTQLNRISKELSEKDEAVASMESLFEKFQKGGKRASITEIATKLNETEGLLQEKTRLLEDKERAMLDMEEKLKVLEIQNREKNKIIESLKVEESGTSQTIERFAEMFRTVRRLREAPVDSAFVSSPRKDAYDVQRAFDGISLNFKDLLEQLNDPLLQGQNQAPSLQVFRVNFEECVNAWNQDLSRALDNVQFSFKEQEAEKDSLAANVASLHALVKEKDQELNELVEEHKNLKNDFETLKGSANASKDTLQQKLIELQETIQRLEKEHSVGRNKLEETTAALGKTRTELEEATKEAKEAQEKEKKTRKELERMQQEISASASDKDTHIAQLRKEVASVQEERQVLLTKISNAQETRVSLERTVAEQIREVEQVKQDMKTQLAEKSTQIMDLEQKLADTDAEAKQLGNEVKRLNKLLAMAREEQTLMQSHEKENNELLQAKNSEIADLKLKITQLESFRESLEQNLSESSFLAKQVKELEQVIQGLRDEKREQEKNLEDLGIDNERIKAELEILQKTMNARSERLHDLEAQLQDYQEIKHYSEHFEKLLASQHEEMMLTLKKYGIDLSFQLKNDKNVIIESYLNAEREARDLLERMVDNLQNQYNKEIDDLKLREKEAERKLLLTEKKAEDLEKSLTDKKVELTAIRERLVSAEERLSESHRVTLELKNENAALRTGENARQGGLTMKIEKLKTENEALRTRIKDTQIQKQQREHELMRLYDSQMQKILKRMELQSQQRTVLEDAKKKSHRTLLETYEAHIQSLSNELNQLRVVAMKSQIKKAKEGPFPKGELPQVVPAGN